jgi:hypothetical protein
VTTAAAAGARGVHLLDAPVTASSVSQGILARAANFLVGGPAEIDVIRDGRPGRSRRQKDEGPCRRQGPSYTRP